MKKQISKAVLAVCLLSPFCANADFITVGTFEWFEPAGDQATSEALGNVSGLGTSSIEIGVALNGSERNQLDFTGISGEGDLPTDFFNIGSITAFNGDVIYNGPPFPFPLVLDVSGQQCDDDGLNCVEVLSGQTLIYNYFTINTDDPVESADSFCTEVLGGDLQCAWQFEQTTQSYDLIGQFGSLTILDIIPTSPGAFVTIGNDPTMNVIHSVPIPEPGTLPLFGLGLLGLGLARKKAT